MDPVFHSIGQLIQLLLGIGKLLPGLRQILLCLLGKLILLNVFLMPLHPILRLPDLPNGLRDSLTHIALLRPDFLARQ